MPSSDSSALIVARFLRSNQYQESYEAFVGEAGLADDAGTVGKGDLTLETLLEQKKFFDLSVHFEKLGTDDSDSRWSLPAPSQSRSIDSLPSATNVLSARVDTLLYDDDTLRAVILSTSADRRLNIVDVFTNDLRHSFAHLSNSPILYCVSYHHRFVLCTTMAGQLIMFDTSGKVMHERKDHSKYIVTVICHETADGDDLIATAGWDNKITLYRPTGLPRPSIGEPMSSILLPTKPEAIAFLRHPASQASILLVSRTDSNHIYYYTTDASPRLLGKQNLAPQSNAWVAFTPSSFAVCPTDQSLLAVATSSLPHMKVLVVRLLFPPVEAQSTVPAASTPRSPVGDGPETQASQARSALALADREHSAIQIHANTMAPQTPYSTPVVVWRPDGTGLWVNGDDGVIRGIETNTGKVVCALRGHEAGSKVRCLWAGKVGGEEMLISGGFDHKLLLWRTSSG